MKNQNIKLFLFSTICALTLVRCVPGGGLSFKGSGGGSSGSATSAAAAATGGGAAGGSSGGSSGSGAPVVTSAGAFQQTLYPVVSKYCASCHNGGVSPNFASSDPTTAYNTIINATNPILANFTTPANSELVLRLSRDGHHCWSSSCTNDAATMQAAIVSWNTMVQQAAAAAAAAAKSGTSTSTSTATSTATKAAMQSTVAVLIPATIPTGGAMGTNTYTTLSFKLDDANSTINPKITGAVLSVDVQMFDNSSYRIHNPRISSPNFAILLKDVEFAINGVINPNENTYSLVNETIAKTSGTAMTNILTADMEMIQTNGPGKDTLQVSFGTIMAP